MEGKTRSVSTYLVSKARCLDIIETFDTIFNTSHVALRGHIPISQQPGLLGVADSAVFTLVVFFRRVFLFKSPKDKENTLVLLDFPTVTRREVRVREC